MKHCTTCQHLFPDHFQACPMDNLPLRTARELEPGMIVRGKYIILEWIGSGGMAAVYRARHRLLNEMRAVKVVSPKFARDEDFLWRFRHEAAIARKLRHENAVWVEDLDEIEDGRPFIAMEFLQGQDLRKLIKDQGPIPVERSLKLGAQVASALSAAHKLGIIHRDIKPDNIFITQDSSGNEIAKVLDFGIAKAKESALQGGFTATKTGVIIGTPEYMSPEQAEGQLGDKLDGRADLYSLGVVLYEMLTGQLPFHSDTPLGMCLHHLQTQPRPPHELRPDLRIPEAVSAVLMKALEKRRERRFQSADEMLAALRQPPESTKPLAGNGSGAFAPTKITGKQARLEQEPTAALSSSLAAVAESQRVASAAAAVPARAAEAAKPSPKPEQDSAPAVHEDKNKRWRIMLVAAAVIVFAVVGYLVLKVNERRNAALREHDAAIHDLVVQKLQTSPVLQGRSQNITVTVSSDAVTLGGNVPLPGDKDEAGNEARSVAGVSNVTNNIEVTGMHLPSPAKSPETGGDNVAQPQTQQVIHSTKKQVRPSKPVPDLVTDHEATQTQVNDLVRLGNQDLDQGNYAGAIGNFGKAMRLDPSSTAARSGLQRARKAQAAEANVLQKQP
ncbi:MAG TPA: protein kinase [Candidatus Angelobacter sp.]